MTARAGRFPLLRLVPDVASAGRRWRDDAACVGVDPEAFYPEDIAQADAVEPVRRVCRGCPVRAECLAEVMATEEPSRRWGVIAGTTPSERRLLHRAGLTVTAPSSVGGDAA